MVSMEGYTKIVNFMTPWVGIVVLRFDNIGDIVKMLKSIKNQVIRLTNWIIISKKVDDHKFL